MADNKGIYEWWKRNVPADARLYTQTLFGDRTKPFTEKDFTPSELKALEETIQASKPRLASSLKDQKLEAENAQRFSNMYSADNANKMLSMVKKDPEWKQLSAMHNKYLKEGELQIPEKYRNQYAILSQKIGDRYKDFGIGTDNLSTALASQNNIPQIFNNLLNKSITDSPQNLVDKAARNEQYINQGTGNVQYSDYVAANINRGINAGAVSDKALGRFQYKTDPITGQRQIIDNYDFSNPSRDRSVESYSNMGPVEKAANVITKGIKSNHGPFLGLAGEVGNAYIGKDGRPVDIKYDPNMIEKKKGGKVKLHSNVDTPIKGRKRDI
jgi:hypothetical protein